MQRRPSPDRQGGQVCATSDLVAPLASSATVTRALDSDGISRPEGSSAVSAPIGASLRCGDVDSAYPRSTPRTAIMPGTRTSTTATRTTGTRTTRFAPVPSADQPDGSHAELSFEEVALAYFDCRQHKRNSNSALAFERRLESNLIELYEELRDGSYQPGASICFIITRPKPREVWAADFRDRIVHHVLYNRVAPRFYRAFIADSCACIPGRGTLYAAKRLEAKVRSITQNWHRGAYYLKCDFANFFVSIDKYILRNLLAARIHETWWMRLAETVVFHDPRQCVVVQSSDERLSLVPPHKSLFRQPAHKGLPIGNLSSQFFANIYLDTLDQFIKHRIGAKYYIRYVDDFVLLHESPAWLNQARERINAFAGDDLALQLNPAKTILQPIDRGIDFVGQVIKPWRRIMRRRTAHDALHRVRSVASDRLFEIANSYFGLFRQAPHSHADRIALAKALMQRGLSIDYALTKTFRQRNKGDSYAYFDSPRR